MVSLNCTGDEIILATGRNLKWLNWEWRTEPCCCKHWQGLSGSSVRGRKILVIWRAVIRWLLVQITSQFGLDRLAVTSQLKQRKKSSRQNDSVISLKSGCREPSVPQICKAGAGKDIKLCFLTLPGRSWLEDNCTVRCTVIVMYKVRHGRGLQ